MQSLSLEADAKSKPLDDVKSSPSPQLENEAYMLNGRT